MLKDLKKYIERTAFFDSISRQRRKKRLLNKYHVWKKAGSILPMPHYGKQLTVLEYIESYKPLVFVETGTYKGDMVYAFQHKFDKVFSIELDKFLCLKAQKRFAGYDHIEIIQGQSDEVLPEILKDITQPCLFWLDAHYSGGCTAKGKLETPIIQELKCILNHPNADKHIVLIDDARCFIGENDYPTINGLKKFILEINSNWNYAVKDDIIRVFRSTGIR